MKWLFLIKMVGIGWKGKQKKKDALNLKNWIMINGYIEKTILPLGNILVIHDRTTRYRIYGYYGYWILGKLPYIWLHDLFLDYSWNNVLRL